MTEFEFYCRESYLKIALRSELFVSQERLALLEFSVSSLSGSERLKATRGSHAPAVRHLSLHLFLCPSLVPTLSLSLPRPPHAFRYTHRPAWTPAIRLTVEEMRTLEARRGIDLRDDFSDLAALWFITRVVRTMKNALQCARLNKSLFCESYWHFSTCKVSKIIALLLRSIIKLSRKQRMKIWEHSLKECNLTVRKCCILIYLFFFFHYYSY